MSHETNQETESHREAELEDASEGDDASETFVHKVRRLSSTAQVLRRHSLELHQQGSTCRERAQQLDRELDDALKALPRVPEAAVLRLGLERLRKRAGVLANISEHLIEQTHLVNEESDAVEQETRDLQEKALALTMPQSRRE